MLIGRTLRVQVYNRWWMDMQQIWVNHTTKPRWSCKQLCSGIVFLLEPDICAIRNYDVSSLTVSSQVHCSSSDDATAEVRKRLTGEDVDLTEDERQQIREFLDAYNEWTCSEWQWWVRVLICILYGDIYIYIGRLWRLDHSYSNVFSSLWRLYLSIWEVTAGRMKGEIVKYHAHHLYKSTLREVIEVVCHM